MDVEDAFGILVCKIGGQDAHEARKHDQLYAARAQCVVERRLERRSCRIVRFGQHERLHAVVLCACERESLRVVGHDERYLAAFERARVLGVEDRLQVRAAARNEYRDLYHRITPSSARTISPMI